MIKDNKKSLKKDLSLIDKILLNNKLPLIIVVLFAIIVTFSIIYINSTSNILGSSYRDAYLYLIQALKWSGHPITGYDYVNYLSPLVPFLTAILFKIGFVSESSLFLTSGIFYICGIIGIYYLLNLRFDKYVSCFGSILYGSLSINLMWTGNGTLDIASIAFSILAIYFFIIAMEKSQKYFYIAIPLGVLSFLGKYTGGLIFAVMLLYFLSKKDIFGNIKKYIKNIIGGLITSLIFIIPFLGYYYINDYPLGFLTQANEISNEATTRVAVSVTKEVSNNIFYYFQQIPRFIYSPKQIIGYIFLVIGLIGIIYGIYIIIKNTNNKYNNSPKKIATSFIPKLKLNKNIFYIIMLLTVVLMIISFLNVANISFIISEAIFFVSLFIFSICVNSIFNEEINSTNSNYNSISLSFDLAMIGWFIGYMIFFSAHFTKADRYFTALAPSFVFFISFGLNVILNKLNNFDKIEKINKEYHLNKIIPIILIVILLITTIGYLTIDKHDPLVDEEKEVSEWIKLNIPNYANAHIVADRAPIYTWYLKTGIPYHFILSEGMTHEKQLNEENATYYIRLNNDTKINGFKIIKTIGPNTIYKRA